MQTRAKSGIFKPKVCYIAQPDYLHTEPPSYKVAVQFPQWCTAMQEKYDALQRQGTWSLVSSPPSKNIVGCKWVYKLKHNSDGSISRYKAKLVAKGFHQQYGVDYAKTFSPVVKPPTVRLVISLVVSLNWPLRQLDVRNAFLHGTLQEEVYMQQPSGYVHPDHPNLVCKLHKSLYGLKQAPRAWFESFTSQLLHLGFTASSVDNSLFIFHDKHIIAYLLLYVDDIVITSNTPSYLDHLIQSLSSVFELKDLGPLSYFLGLQIHKTSQALVKPNMPQIYFINITCLTPNQPIHLVFPIPDSLLQRVLYSKNLIPTEAWLELSITSISHALTCHFLFTKCVSSCTLLLQHILLPLSAF